MNFTRRDVVKGISGAAAMALAAESSSFASESNFSVSGHMTSSSDLPWPRMQGNPVIESLRPVIANSRDVMTHYDKIREIAGWMAYEELPFPNLAVPFGMEKTPDIDCRCEHKVCKGHAH